MTHKERLIQFFNDSQSKDTRAPLIFMPDLTTWYSFHSKNGTLPSEFKGKNLEEIYRTLKVPIWNTFKPWKEENTEVQVSRIKNSGELITSYHYKNSTLTAKWIKGPDGDWWQTEYPVKRAEDLQVLKAYLKGRTFHIELDKIVNLLKETGDDGIVVPFLPSRLFSWLMLEMLGWSEGLMILLDEENTIRELVELGEVQILNFTERLVKVLKDKGFQIFLSPDNLDGMFISPEHFDEYLKHGYENSSKICHKYNSFLIVHGGGPLLRILEQISQTGIDCIAGICGPPQGDTPIKTARERVKKSLNFWGFLPQDYLMDSSGSDVFIMNIKEIINSCRENDRTIFGIADHVPLDADITKLKQIIDMISDFNKL